MRQAGQARPQPNKLTSSKHMSTELARELPSRGAAGITGSNQPAATFHGLLISSKSSKPRARPCRMQFATWTSPLRRWGSSARGPMSFGPF